MKYTKIGGATATVESEQYTIYVPDGSVAGVYTFNSGTYDASGGCNIRFDMVNNSGAVPSANIASIENQYH